MVSSFVGLAYEGISSFLHNRRHKAVKTMDSKTTIQYNKLMHLEDSMVMCSIYNAETLEQLINTIHGIHNTTSSNENYLWDIQVKQHFNPYMQMHKAYNTTP